MVNTSNSEVKNYVFIAYVTYALGLFIWFAPVVGVILAYVKRDEAQGSIYASHIDWLIKTFWVSFGGYAFRDVDHTYLNRLADFGGNRYLAHFIA